MRRLETAFRNTIKAWPHSVFANPSRPPDLRFRRMLAVPYRRSLAAHRRVSASSERRLWRLTSPRRRTGSLFFDILLPGGQSDRHVYDQRGAVGVADGLVRSSISRLVGPARRRMRLPTGTM